MTIKADSVSKIDLARTAGTLTQMNAVPAPHASTMCAEPGYPHSQLKPRRVLTSKPAKLLVTKPASPLKELKESPSGIRRCPREKTAHADR